MLDSINIIAFNVPYPANYGGVIDVFYKLKYFHQKGIKIHLHCFDYGRGEQHELNKYCKSVHYYKRKTGIVSLLNKVPYIVKSRSSEELKNNLLQNDFPILFEGLHSCFLMGDPAFKNRIKLFRESNIEHDYYNHLALAEKNPLKKFYYQREAKKLQQFEPVIKNATVSFVVSLSDLTYFEQAYPNNKFVFVPSFHPGNEVKMMPGKGDYVLYHGNLSVAENENAAKYIVNKVFSNLETPLVVAGLNPSKNLKQLIDKHPHIRLVENPTDAEMYMLIAEAQINFLYTEQPTGLKLKLLNVLYNGRFCLVNSNMVQGTSLAKACIVKDNANDLKMAIQSNFNQEMDISLIEQRKTLLTDYSNEFSFQEMMKAF